ncbi:MAG: glycosyltransferase family 2 protein [bacterium]|nr:glycosyltransferase family 2 protein [bacterium]
MKLAIVIPAHNEEKVIGAVLKSLPKKIKGIDEIVSIVVDDGSEDRTYEVAKQYADRAIKLVLNMGVGAATITGLEVAKKEKADIIVTMDADGQHRVKDIQHLIKPILSDSKDVVIGSRMKNHNGMPFVKVFGNWTMNVITFIVFRKWTSDSQSGMKAFSKSALKKMKLHSVGYEICSEIVGEIRRNKLAFTEVPIEVVYTDYSRAKGQDILNAVNILTKSIAIRIGRQK